MPQLEVQPLWPDDKSLGFMGGPLFEMANGKRYAISSTLAATQPAITQQARVEITRFVMENGNGAIPAVVTSQNLPSIINRAPLPTKEKAWRLLKEIVGELHGRPGTTRWGFSPHIPEYLDRLRRIGLNMDNEILRLLDYLAYEGFVVLTKYVDLTIDIELPVAGLIRFESEKEISDSSNAFVAMWFSPELTDAFESAIAPAIEVWGYTPVRIDRQEHNNKIDDEIISEIRRARFVVADFSCGTDGVRGGVYYEAGFAAGLGKDVIFTVRQSDLPRLHFDTRQFNHIVWEDVSGLKSGLEHRIGATIGMNVN